MNEDGSLGGSFLFGNAQAFEPLFCGGGVFENLGVAEDFEAGLVGVVHEEEGNAIVVKEIAGADVLHVAAEVGESESGVVDDAEKALGAAAVLDVGPAGFADGGHVEAVASADEVLLGGAEAVAGAAGGFDALVLRATAMTALLIFDEGGEGELCEAFSHGARC